MSEYISKSTREILHYSQINNWEHQKEKKSSLPFSKFNSRTVTTNLDYLTKASSFPGYELLHKNKTYLIMGSRCLQETPIWFFDFRNTSLPIAELNSLFNSHFNNAFRNMVGHPSLLFKCLNFLDSILVGNRDIVISTLKKPPVADLSLEETLTMRANLIGIDAYNVIDK